MGSRTPTELAHFISTGMKGNEPQQRVVDHDIQKNSIETVIIPSGMRERFVLLVFHSG